MKYKAVIFDLFGTLVEHVTIEHYQGMLTEIASALSINSDVFLKLWVDTSDERIKGIISNFRENVEYICRQAGTPIENTRIELATQIRFDMIKSEIVPRKDSITVLSRLKKEDYKIGLISDCTHEGTIVWENTPFPALFDTIVFSCAVGLKKPDPRIYKLAIDKLGVKPEACLYIGDGGSQELIGASRVGMQAVLIDALGNSNDGMYRGVTEAEKWDGPVISSLKEVLNLVE